MSLNVLTRAQYQEAIRREHAEEERQLMERWDMGAAKYGPCELDMRDWIKEGKEEELDRRAYHIIERERIRRLAQKVAVTGYRVP